MQAMWVFCGGMKRSGSTLQFQITARLVEDAGLGKRVEWVHHNRFPELRKKYADYNGWKVFKNHVCTDEMVAEFNRQNAIGVYVYRDIRDVIVSAMRKSSVSFTSIWRNSHLLKTCLDNFHRWTSLPTVLVSIYEEMIADLPGEVKRIANHLGIALDYSECERVASEYTIERQKKRIKESMNTALRQEGDALFDPHSLLHINHIDSGSIGKWRHELTPRQVALIESEAGEWLVANGYKLAYPHLNLFKRILLKTLWLT